MKPIIQFDLYRPSSSILETGQAAYMLFVVLNLLVHTNNVCHVYTFEDTPMCG